MIKTNQNQSISILLGLLLVALLWNLGTAPILADEPTRTVVAQELDFNNNLIVPTINGEYYYNKPPVYNWIILGFYKITGSKSEFVSRLPVVISIFLYLGTLFWWCKKYMTKTSAMLTGLIFATGSRLLFYDSLLGLIDVFFGWLILVTFIIVYELEKSKKYTLLFVSTYAIVAICFLMKGLQAVAFQGMTLLGWFIYKKSIKQLFRYPHFIGLGVFIAIIGSFLWQYHQYNSIPTLIETLWTESSKRTIGKNEWFHDLTHIFLFPIKIIFADIFPWGLFLIPLFLSQKIRKQIFKNELNKFVTVMFLSNIIVYWFSPETRGRYLYPHYALLAILTTSVLANFRFKNIIYDKLTVIVKPFIFVLAGVALITLVYALGVDPNNKLSSFYEEIIPNLAILIMVTAIALIISKPLNSFYAIVLTLVVCRFVFNAVVLPYRKHTEPFEHYKQEALRVGKIYQDKPLLIYQGTPIDHSTSHYFMIEQARVIPRVQKKQTTEAYYLLEKSNLGEEDFEIIDSFPQNWEHRIIYVAK